MQPGKKAESPAEKAEMSTASPTPQIKASKRKFRPPPEKDTKQQ